MAKFTFKYHPTETGLAAVGNPNRSSDIKLKGKVVGRIVAPNWRSKDDMYKVTFRVVDSTVYCGWKWVTLKQKDFDEKKLRTWLQENTDKIVEAITLYIDE